MSKLPVLMYHKVTDCLTNANDLTIHINTLEAHFKHLADKQFQTFHLKELLQLETIPKKSIVITFDDVTKGQLTHALPLLEKYRLKATFFIPFKYIGKTEEWNLPFMSKDKIETLLTIEELNNLPKNLIELGHHSYAHINFKTSSITTIEDDFTQSKQFIDRHKLSISPVIAYPYGKFPKEPNKFKMFCKVLKSNNLWYGFRIGNRINRFPFKNPYQIFRIDIKAEDSLFKFRLKLRYGKLKLF